MLGVVSTMNGVYIDVSLRYSFFVAQNCKFELCEGML